jgi:hypothetical protein
MVQFQLVKLLMILIGTDQSDYVLSTLQTFISTSGNLASPLIRTY